MKLYMLLLGCTPPGRNIEQHDIFFTIGESLNSIVPKIKNFWPEGDPIHIDGWREVNEVDGYKISVLERSHKKMKIQEQLFFVNLGGYKLDEFEEYHYKMLAIANSKGDAVMASKKTAFYMHTGFKGAESHIDDKFGIDVDDIYKIDDLLASDLKNKYCIIIEKNKDQSKDKLHLGYLMLEKIQ